MSDVILRKDKERLHFIIEDLHLDSIPDQFPCSILMLVGIGLLIEFARRNNSQVDLDVGNQVGSLSESRQHCVIVTDKPWL